MITFEFNFRKIYKFASTISVSFLTGTAMAGTGLGAYVGGNTNTGSFANFVGTEVTVSGDFLNGKGWDAYTSPSTNTPLSSWAEWERAVPGRIVTIGMPPYAWDAGANYQQCAAGVYNDYYKQLAQNVIDSGVKRVDLRIAWEFNGDWTIPWQFYPNGDSASFTGCWRQIVTSVHSIDTNRIISFDWNQTAGCCNYISNDYWPGDEYVDYVGYDFYDVQSIDATKSILTNIKAFANQHGKKITFPEWGLWTTKQGDDPAFVQAMYDFASDPSSNVAWLNYFDVSADVDHRLTGSTLYPNAAALYQKLFSGYNTPVGVEPTSSVATPSIPSSVTPGSKGFNYCADENGYCAFSGERLVSYGSNGVFWTTSAGGGANCNSSTFGDPTPGVAKHCEVQNQTITWIPCGLEGQTCSFSGTRLVRFGANGSYYTQWSTGSADCSNLNFGDPALGIYKSCDYVQ